MLIPIPRLPYRTCNAFPNSSVAISYLLCLSQFHSCHIVLVMLIRIPQLPYHTCNAYSNSTVAISYQKLDRCCWLYNCWNSMYYTKNRKNVLLDTSLVFVALWSRFMVLLASGQMSGNVGVNHIGCEWGCIVEHQNTGEGQYSGTPDYWSGPVFWNTRILEWASVLEHQNTGVGQCSGTLEYWSGPVFWNIRILEWASVLEH